MKKLFIPLISFILFLISVNVVKAATITSVQSGNWSNNNTWDCSCVPGPGDNVVIGTHIITVNNSFSVTDIDVTIGGILTSNGKTLTVTGNLTIDGFIGGAIKLVISGTNNIAGSGTISTNGAITLTGGDKTILGGTSIDNSQATLSVITIDAGVTVTNNGFWISGAEIKGNAASSTWVQGAGSSLRIGNKMLITGTLDASGVGNTIEYYEDGNQSIKTASGAYYNLVLSGSGSKSLSLAPLDIDGSLDIQSGTLTTNNWAITIAGDWTNNGTLADGTGRVTFDGTSLQKINSPGGETFYWLRIFNLVGIQAFDDIICKNVLDLNGGNIDMGANRLTIGTGAGSIGTLSQTSGSVIGELERWIDPSFTGYDFFVGTELSERPAQFFIFPAFVNPGALIGTVIIKFVDEAPGNAGLPVVDPPGPTTLYNTFSEGYWDIQSANGIAAGTLGYSMILTANDFTSFTIGANSKSLYRPNSAANWAITGVSQANAGNDIWRIAIPDTDLSGQFAVGDDTNCAAPVSPVISGSSAVCNGDLGEVYSVVPNTDTYTWSITGGTIVSANPASSITVDWGVVTGIESVVVVASNGCTSAFPVTYPVKIGPLPTSSPPTGKTNVADLTADEPYSVVNEAGYTYTWTIIGGTLDLGQGTNNITVDWGVEGTGNVSVVGSNGCGSAAPEAIDINIYDAIESAKTGNYGTNNTWTSNSSPLTTESFRIMPTHAVKLTGNETIANANIEPGGILDLSGNNLTVTGHITMHGFVIGTGDIILSGNAKFIDGAGLFQNTGDIIISGGGKTMVSPTALSKVNGDLTIANNLTVTNNGVFNLDGSLIGGNVNSQFINAANSTLSVAGVLLSTGLLVSNANVNTVNYIGLVDQTIFPTTYHHLGSSGDGIKSLSANTDINGELAISDGASLDVTLTPFTINLGGDWNNTGIDADPFVERTSTVTFDGSTLQTLTATLASGETFNDFVINNAAGATLDDPLTIASSMTLANGIINTSAGNELIIADDATTTVAADFSHVDGPMDKIGDDAFVFPVGDAGDYQAIEISAPGLTTDRFQAQYFQTAHPDQINMDLTLDHVSAMEYWDLSLIAGAPTVNVTLHWDSYSIVSVIAGERNDLRAAHYLAGNWTDEGNDGITGDETAGTIVVNGISAFSPWTLASISSNNPLPITLLDFKAAQADAFIELTWSTASEINNDYFTVERKTDSNQEFMAIGRVEGAGNSTSQKDYSLTDNYPITGFNYYRLKQTDFDGAFAYSKIVAVDVEEAIRFIVYPNPSRGKIDIKVSQLQSPSMLIIYDNLGKQIRSEYLSEQESQFTLATNLRPGLYFIFVTDGLSSQVKKVLIEN